MKRSRRDSVVTNLVGGAAIAGAQSVAAAPAIAQAAPVAPPLPNPETIGRRGVGLHGYDPARSFGGFVLFTPEEPNRTVYLIDMLGNVVHTWTMPYPPGAYGYLTSRGRLFYNGKLPEHDSFIGHSVFRGGAIMEVDWNGRVRWEVRKPDQTHDGRLLPNGNILVACSQLLPAEIARRVRGGLAGTEQPGGAINGDYLVEMTTDGKVVWEWRSWEHLNLETDVITALQDPRSEWTHANAVIEMPDGNIMMSFRNISTIVIIDRKTGNIIWKLGAPPLAGQHNPTPLPNGHILVYDNGPHRLDSTWPFSRVLEIDRATKAIVWKYEDDPVWKFFSPRISSAQRLPNGNTQICEGFFGRVFEVTPAGDVVWEYVNPYFMGPPDRPKEAVNQLFRAYRYSRDEIARAKATAG